MCVCLYLYALYPMSLPYIIYMQDILLCMLCTCIAVIACLSSVYLMCLCNVHTDIKSRISKLEDMKNRRLEHLRNKYKDTYNAVLWLRANQHKFKAPVHEPILLQASLCIPLFVGNYLYSSLSNNYYCKLVHGSTMSFV